MQDHSNRGLSLIEKLQKQVVQKSNEECWPYTGRIDPKGYGYVKHCQKRYAAHRLAYELSKGEIPAGLVIDHLCRNRACCNPSHMEAVTNRENLMRGNGICAANARSTHCPNGHERTPENTLTNSGSRKCRPCMVANSAASYLRRKAR